MATALERFASRFRVSPDNGCWLWTGARTGSGYGAFLVDGRLEGAHRFAVVALTGAVIPQGMHVDHICRTPRCVNPEHLEVVTPRENTLRGAGPAAKNAAKTGCHRGHPYDEANTYIDERRGRRECRICRAESARRFLQRKAG